MTPALVHRYLDALPGDATGGHHPRVVEHAAYSLVEPTPVRAPSLLAWSDALAKDFGLARPDTTDSSWLDVLAGNRRWPGTRPYANCYGGHQFGHWAGQLGDGRAITLGEFIDRSGRIHEFQLKGAGPTPYSRGADGRAVLRSSLREFICSEAMHALGVPTTRALSLVATGEQVVRDMFYDGHPAPEPGAIVCRVAPSFLRLGSYELPAARGDHDLLRRMVQYTISEHEPTIDPQSPEAVSQWFDAVCRRTAALVIEWTRVGFVHGVMNTDNLSIHGLTIDYGPYGWLEPYEPNWTPNTTDAQMRRYCFGRQPSIAQWNLSRFGGALAPLVDNTEALEAGLERYAQVYEASARQMYADKLGLAALEGAEDEALLSDLFKLMQQTETDYCLFFRCLAEVPAEGAPDSLRALFEPAYYRADDLRGPVGDALLAWLARYQARIGRHPSEQRREAMNAVNPLYVPRNYLAQQAIEAAEQGDLSELERLCAVLSQPYSAQPGAARYAARRPDWARHRPGCAALSCSS